MSNMTQFVVKSIIKQYSDGATIGFIGESRGISRQAITRLLRNAGITIRQGRRPGSSIREFRGRTIGRAGRQVLTLPGIRKARTLAQVGGPEISELLGRYPAWVSLVENGTLKATPERLTAIRDAIEALSPESSPTVAAAAEERARRFRDPDANGKRYAKRGTGYKAKRKSKKVAAAKQVESEVTEIMNLSVRPETKTKILLALFGQATADELQNRAA